MISALACAISLSQKPPTVDYSVPLGASSEFHALVNEVKSKLAAKDFAGAGKLGKLLPQSVITYRFNYAKVPADRLESYKQSISFAIDSWQKYLDGKATLVEAKSGTPNILFSFEPVLAKLPDTGEIPGATWFYSTEATRPRIETVIGLKRTAQLVEAKSTEVFNEVMFGIGSYLGLAPSPVYGTAMGRVNGTMGGMNLVSKGEAALSESNLRLAKALRVAALAKTVVKPTTPQIVVSGKSFQFKSAFQGDTVYEFMTVINKGDAPLKLKAYGDCSCISGDIIDTLKPGESAALKARYRTDELQGDIEHNVVLMSNDPEEPAQKFPAKIHVEPRAELVYPTSDTVLIDSDQHKLSFYIHSSEPVKWDIIAAQLIPLDSKVVWEPFEGDVSDWKRGGQKRYVKGFKVTADFSTLPANQVFGRIMMSVYVRLTNENLKLITAPIFIQKGIVAQPENIYLGAPTGPTESNFLLTRPGKPFKILNISCDSKFVRVSVASSRLDSEYTITAKYDGKAPEHRIDTKIVIKTDDPKQSEIVLPLTTAQQ